MQRTFSIFVLLAFGVSILGCGAQQAADPNDSVAVTTQQAVANKAADRSDRSSGSKTSEAKVAYRESSRRYEEAADHFASDMDADPGPAAGYAGSGSDAGSDSPSAPAEAAPPPTPTASEAPAADSAPRGGDEAPARSPEKADPDPRHRVEIKRGTLTAGSFDDHDNLEDFREFVSRALQNDASEVLPRFALGERVMIRVQDEQGRPVGDARVAVREVNADGQTDGDPLIDLATASDGRALFLTGHDRGRAESYEVAVTSADGGQTVTQTLKPEMAPWRITLPDASAALPNRLDLALVIDCTGSMRDELDYLKVEIDGIVEAVNEMFPNVDQRYALIVYRDQGDEYVVRTFDFTGSLSEYRATLARQKAAGGGDKPEAMHVALAHAGKLSWRDRDTARVMFLLADAPPHSKDCPAALEAVEDLRRKSVRVYPVAASGTALPAEYVLRSAAFATLGQYLFLTDHSGVGNPHATPHVPSFVVEHLNRLMIRMIASELAGARLVPEEVIAIERGELDPSDADQWSNRRGQAGEEPNEQTGDAPPAPPTGNETNAPPTGAAPPAEEERPDTSRSERESWGLFAWRGLSIPGLWWAAMLLVGGAVLVGLMERLAFR